MVLLKNATLLPSELRLVNALAHDFTPLLPPLLESIKQSENPWTKFFVSGAICLCNDLKGNLSYSVVVL